MNGRRVFFRLARLQGGIAIVLGLAMVAAGYREYLPSMLLGVVLMSLNAAVLLHTVQRAAGRGRRHGQRLLYGTAAARFVALIAVLAAAYGMGFYLPWVAGGVLAAQVAVYVVGLETARRDEG